MDNELVKKIEARVQSLLQEANHLYDEDELEEKLRASKRKITKYIRENPVQCLIAGFSAGFLIARILRSDSKSD